MCATDGTHIYHPTILPWTQNDCIEVCAFCKSLATISGRYELKIRDEVVCERPRFRFIQWVLDQLRLLGKPEIAASLDKSIKLIVTEQHNVVVIEWSADIKDGYEDPIDQVDLELCDSWSSVGIRFHVFSKMRVLILDVVLLEEWTGVTVKSIRDIHRSNSMYSFISPTDLLLKCSLGMKVKLFKDGSSVSHTILVDPMNGVIKFERVINTVIVIHAIEYELAFPTLLPWEE
jgi:hypothetical protein